MPALYPAKAPALPTGVFHHLMRACCFSARLRGQNCMLPWCGWCSFGMVNRAFLNSRIQLSLFNEIRSIVTYSDKIALNRVFQRRIRILRQTCTERQFFQALFGCVPVFKRAITCSNTNVAFRVMYAGIAELYKDCGLRYHFSNLKHF